MRLRKLRKLKWGHGRLAMRVGRAVVLTLAFAVALGTTAAFAVHDDGIFQLDGDALNATCGAAFPNGTPPPPFLGCTGEDWDTLYTCASDGALGCAHAIPCDSNGDGVQDVCSDNHANQISVLVTDPSPLSIFTGGGSKDEKDLTQWQWKNGSSPDKDDLIESFAALYVGAPGSARAGHKIVYFGSNRLAVDGDAQIGFWFLQNPVALGGTGQTASPFVDSTVGGAVSHKIGDVLILSNFVNGGGSSNIQVYVVNKITKGNCPAGSVETKAGAGDICLTQVINGTAGANGVCNSATVSPAVPADTACAATNGAVIDALDPDFLAKSGAGTGQYPIVGFFEGGLDLTAIGLGGECFPTFVVETRSSQSITAVLKDLTLGQFERCVAEIETQIFDNATPPNEVTNTCVSPGTVIHDVATVTGIAGGPDPGVGGDGACTAARPCTVTFRRFVDTGDCTTTLVGCTGTAISETVDCVSNGDLSGTCTATSSNFTTLAPPGYSYLATYNGDSNYPPIALPATSCELVGTGKLNSNIATHILLTQALGGCTTPPCEITDSSIDINNSTSGTTVTVQDQAVVTQDGSGGPTPTGTVTFTRYSNADCSGTVTTDSCGGSGCALDGSGNALSTVFNLGASGLSFRAVYGGDNVYNGSETSRCEPVCAINSAIQ
jgi:hypothetical protein